MFGQKYCESVFQYKRRPTHEVMVGDIGIGGENPIRVQSMTISDTMDTEATVREAVGLAEAGCEIVRITAPSMKEAHNLANIKQALKKASVKVPLVADIHFTPNAALIAADYVDKVRINPGNYADKKKFEVREYSDSEYLAELERIRERFSPLVVKCKQNGVAMRIGVNHGSLSDRVMNRYGDTPEGMVASALEFLHICEDLSYRDIVISMKASNTKVMIQAYRQLVAKMYELNMTYPLHLGVTEAGNGEDGRIKSAVGIGTLLEDGVGDTIRVSLTEDAIYEIPVARALAEKYNSRIETQSPNAEDGADEGDYFKRFTPLNPARRVSYPVQIVGEGVGGNEPVRIVLHDSVFANSGSLKLPVLGQAAEQKPEWVIAENGKMRTHNYGWTPIISSTDGIGDAQRISVSINQVGDLKRVFHSAVKKAVRKNQPLLVDFDGFSLPEFEQAQLFQNLNLLVTQCRKYDFWKIIMGVNVPANVIGALTNIRRFLATLAEIGLDAPLLLNYRVLSDQKDWQLDAAATMGALLNDGIGDAVSSSGATNHEEALRFIYTLLQATRIRISKTEYIACPSCGRTLFNLQTTTKRIQAQTDHLKGVKIAIMGCIVNGPGEMADADFGYVGSGHKKVNLFVGKECVERNIPEEDADRRLIELIKKHGMWMEPKEEAVETENAESALL